MIALPGKTRIWIAAGVTDLRRGFTGLSALVQTKLEQSPFSGHVFVFRGRRGDLIKTAARIVPARCRRFPIRGRAFRRPCTLKSTQIRVDMRALYQVVSGLVIVPKRTSRVLTGRKRIWSRGGS